MRLFDKVDYLVIIELKSHLRSFQTKTLLKNELFITSGRSVLGTYWGKFTESENWQRKISAGNFVSIVTIHVCQPQAVVLILGFQQLTDKPEQILLELKYQSQNNLSTDSSLLQIYKPYRNSLGLWIVIFHLITIFSRLNFQKLESMRRL